MSAGRLRTGSGFKPSSLSKEQHLGGGGSTTRNKRVSWDQDLMRRGSSSPRHPHMTHGYGHGLGGPDVSPRGETSILSMHSAEVTGRISEEFDDDVRPSTYSMASELDDDSMDGESGLGEQLQMDRAMGPNGREPETPYTEMK